MNMIMMIIAAIFGMGISDGATVDEQAVRGEVQVEITTTTTTTTTVPTPVTRGTQVPVSVDRGVCYIDVSTGQGTTEVGFAVCDATYTGEIVYVGEVEPEVAVGQPPVPAATAPAMPTALPTTGSNTNMALFAGGLVMLGAFFVVVTRRKHEDEEVWGTFDSEGNFVPNN